MKFRPLYACIGLLSVLAPMAHASSEPKSEPMLLKGKTVTVTRADADAEILRVPEEARSVLLGQPNSVASLVEGIGVRRALKAEAAAAGLEKDATMAKRLELANERIMAELYLDWLDMQAGAEFDKQKAAFERRAAETYKVDREKFRLPGTVHAAHILIRTDMHSEEEALAKIKKIRQEVVNGLDFAVAAERYSEDPSAKTNKGDLGAFEPGTMVKPFSDAAFAMTRPNQLSEPVKTNFGYHLIKLIERKPGPVPPFEEVAPKLLDDLKSAHIKAVRQQKMQEIRERQAFQWDVEAIRAIAKPTDKNAAQREMAEIIRKGGVSPESRSDPLLK